MSHCVIFRYRRSAFCGDLLVRPAVAVDGLVRFLFRDEGVTAVRAHGENDVAVVVSAVDGHVARDEAVESVLARVA